jgi:hypothetical protein
MTALILDSPTPFTISAQVPPPFNKNGKQGASTTFQHSSNALDLQDVEVDPFLILAVCRNRQGQTRSQLIELSTVGFEQLKQLRVNLGS